MKRRQFLGLAGVGLAAAAVPAVSGCAHSPAGQSARLLRSTTRLPRPYQVPLPIPPVKKPVSRTGGLTSYEIIQRNAEVELLPGLRTTVMGYDGIFPGPTIEARRGERVVIRHRNHWRGLAGFHLIRDDIEDRLPLPRGDREILFDDHRPGVRCRWQPARPGPGAGLDQQTWRHRTVRLRLDPPPPGGQRFTVIGSDAGLLAAPVSQPTITTAATERHDVIIDFSDYPVGSELALANVLGSGSTATVMRFRVARKASDDTVIPRTLTELEPLDTTGAVRREWQFTRKPSGGMTMWAINGRFFDRDRMDARPHLGRTGIWRFYTDLNHSVHVHLSPFRVISRNGHRPEPAEAGWKDTLDLSPTEYADVAVRFTNHRGRYLMHCHNLEHGDMGMIAAFEVV